MVIAVGVETPALDGSRRQADHLACGGQPRAGPLRIADGVEDQLSLSSTVVSSSSAENKSSTFF